MMTVVVPNLYDINKTAIGKLDSLLSNYYVNDKSANRYIDTPSIKETFRLNKDVSTLANAIADELITYLTPNFNGGADVKVSSDEGKIVLDIRVVEDGVDYTADYLINHTNSKFINIVNITTGVI